MHLPCSVRLLFDFNTQTTRARTPDDITLIDWSRHASPGNSLQWQHVATLSDVDHAYGHLACRAVSENREVGLIADADLLQLAGQLRNGGHSHTVDGNDDIPHTLPLDVDALQPGPCGRAAWCDAHDDHTIDAETRRQLLGADADADARALPPSSGTFQASVCARQPFRSAEVERNNPQFDGRSD